MHRVTTQKTPKRVEHEKSASLKETKASKKRRYSVGDSEGSSDRSIEKKTKKSKPKESLEVLISPKSSSHVKEFRAPKSLNESKVRYFLGSLGEDVISKKPLHALAQEAFKSSCPYVFAKIFSQKTTLSKEKKFSYADAYNLYMMSCCDLTDPKEIKNRLFLKIESITESKVEDIIFMVATPWSLEPFVLANFESLTKRNDQEVFAHDVLFLREVKTDDPADNAIRGTSFLMFNFGIVVDKNVDIANFLMKDLTAKQRKDVFTETLCLAGQHYSPRLVEACLELGGDPAPAQARAYSFLALTLAVKGGSNGANIENIKLLLAAGADPRQQADFSHGTALSHSYTCSNQTPEIQQLLENYLKYQGKDRNIVLQPVDGKWTEVDVQAIKEKMANLERELALEDEQS